jgi:hypothetical protein
MWYAVDEFIKYTDLLRTDSTPDLFLMMPR